MKQKIANRKVAGINVGSASLVMVFSVLCLTIFAVLSVVTANNALSLAEKSADAVSAYYAADAQAVEILDEITANYMGVFMPLEDYTSWVEVSNGRLCLNYCVPIDDRQDLWVEIYEQFGAICVSRWEVRESQMWIGEQTLNVWAG